MARRRRASVLNPASAPRRWNHGERPPHRCTRSDALPAAVLPRGDVRAEIEAAARRPPDAARLPDRIRRPGARAVGAVRAAHRGARRHPGRGRAPGGTDQRAGTRAGRLAQPRRHRRQEGRAQGRVLRGQPPDRAGPRARLGRPLRSGTRPRPRIEQLEAARARPRGAPARGSRARSRDRGSPVPPDVRRAATRSGCTRSGCGSCCATPASSPTSTRSTRTTTCATRRGPRARSATRFRGSDDAWILYHFSIGHPALRPGARARRALRARLPQRHRREVLLALGAARGDHDARRAPAARGRGARGPLRARRLRVQRAGARRARVQAHRGRTDPHRLRRLRHAARRDAPRRAATRPRRRRLRLALGRTHRAEQVPARRARSRSRCTGASTIRGRASRSSAARAPGSTGGRCTRSPTTSVSPTRSRSPTS